MIHLSRSIKIAKKMFFLLSTYL